MDLKETIQSDCNQTRAGVFYCTVIFMSMKVNVFQDGAKKRGLREAPKQTLMFGQWFSRLAELFWPKTQPSPQSRTIFSIFMVSVSSSDSLFKTGVRRLNLMWPQLKGLNQNSFLKQVSEALFFSSVGRFSSLPPLISFALIKRPTWRKSLVFFSYCSWFAHSGSGFKKHGFHIWFYAIKGAGDDQLLCLWPCKWAVYGRPD